MGFLGIGQKKEGNVSPSKEKLDLPPPPPLNSSKLYSELPSFPGAAPPSKFEEKMPPPLTPLKTDAPDWSEKLPDVPPKPGIEEIPKPELPKPVLPDAPIPEKHDMSEMPSKPTFPTLDKPSFEVPSLPDNKPKTAEPLPFEAAMRMTPVSRSEIEATLGPIVEMPMFMKAYTFGTLMREIERLNNSLSSSLSSLSKLKGNKDLEEKEYDKWHKTLEDIQRKLILADDMIFET
ncbi:MAG: hypothetical protein GY861_10075 [bacterium]|nr:hypothetical protein [bacterium]